MDVAVVTGASSGLGLAISNKLLSLGFKVYGLGGNYAENPLQNSGFIPVNCDLADPAMVEFMALEILKKESAVSVLVNNAKLYPSESFTDGAGGEFARCLNINLLCPLVLVRAFLPGLQKVQGKVITINPATPETSRGGPAGAASSGGLRWMQEVLFQQYRDFGVGFTTISPEPNRWRPADSPKAPNGVAKSTIDPEAISDAVRQIVLNTGGNLITEVVIRPTRLTESSLPAMREVPYPKPQPIPYTVPRELIEAEELAERTEEDRDFQPKRKFKDHPKKAKDPEPEEFEPEEFEPNEDEPAEEKQKPEAQAEGEGEGEGDKKGGRRKRRRRGKRRGKNEREETSESPKEHPSKQDRRPEKDIPDTLPPDPSDEPELDESEPDEAATPEPSTLSTQSNTPLRERRRRRKPRPMLGAAKPGFFTRAEPPPAEKPKPEPVATKEATPASPPADTPAKPVAEKEPEKTPARKAKKVATKKSPKAAKKATTAKKSVKKTAKKSAAKKVARKAVDNTDE